MPLLSVAPWFFSGFSLPSSSFGLSPDPTASSASLSPGLGIAAGAPASDSHLLQSSFFGQASGPPTFPSAVGVATASSVSTSAGGGWPVAKSNAGTPGVATPGGWPAWPTAATSVSTPEEQRRNASPGQDLFACAPTLGGVSGNGFLSASPAGVPQGGSFPVNRATAITQSAGGAGGSALTGAGTYGMEPPRMNGCGGSGGAAAGGGGSEGGLALIGGGSTGGAAGAPPGAGGNILKTLEEIVGFLCPLSPCSLLVSNRSVAARKSAVLLMSMRACA